MTELTVESLRLSEKDKVACWDRDAELTAVKVPKRTVKPLFLANMPVNEALATAKRLGVNPLMLYLLINTAHKMTPGNRWVKVPGKLLDGVGLPRQREYEAAKALEAAGLITRRNKAGSKNMYQLAGDIPVGA